MFALVFRVSKSELKTYYKRKGCLDSEVSNSSYNNCFLLIIFQVPETIAAFLKAGISVWVLTGKFHFVFSFFEIE